METSEKTMTEAEAMTILRRAFPLMRRSCATAIIHSGGKRTIFGCLCGSQHTTSTDWHGRDAKHVQTWQDEHAECAIKIAQKLQAREEVEVHFGA